MIKRILLSFIGIVTLFSSFPVAEAGAINQSTAATVQFTAPDNALYLSAVPELNFEGEISAETAVYANTTEQPSVQVTDLRGTGEGWTLSAALSAVVYEGTDSILDAELIFPQGKVSTTGKGKEPENSGICLIPGGHAKQVMKANLDQGMGPWNLDWSTPDKQINLKVPAGVAKKGNYTATITWTLESTPQ